jgi:hypothetical protein
MKITKAELREIIKEEIGKELTEGNTNHPENQEIERLLNLFDRAPAEDKRAILQKVIKFVGYKRISNSAVSARFNQAKNQLARLADSPPPKDNVDRYFDRYKGTGNLPY